MRKRNINLKEEEANTLLFLEKLNKFKAAGKTIKEKTKSTVHKNQWMKESQILDRLESQLDIDLRESIRAIDLDCGDSISTLDLFTDSKYQAKTFEAYVEELDKKYHVNNLNFWFQVRNVRSLVQELKKKNKEIDSKTMKELHSDVKKFFEQMGEVLNSEYKHELKEREAHAQLISDTINNQDEVHGFDKNLDVNLEVLLGDKRFISEDILESIEPMKENYYHSLNLIDERYELELQALAMDYNKAPPPEMWTEPMKEMFLHIYKTYIKRGKDRDIYMERLAMQFPKMPRKQLEAHDQYIVDNEYYNKKTKALYRDWEKEKLQMKEFAEEQILNQIEYLIRETENELAKIKTNKELLRLQQIIESQRDEFEQKRKEKEEMEERERAKELVLKEIKEEKFKEHAKEVKGIAEKFVDDKKKKEEEAKFIEFKEQEKRKLEVKKQVEKNKPIVIIRQNKEDVKIKTRIDDKSRKLKEKEQHLQRIEKAIEGYADRPVVERDFNRVVKETEALISKKNTKLDKADQVKMFRADGFNIGDLMKDMRYRISSALFDAGLQNTDYAKTLINQLSKPGR